VRFTLTAGQKGDAPQAAALIEGLPAEVVMADTAYDADHLRKAIAAKGALAVTPNGAAQYKSVDERRFCVTMRWGSTSRRIAHHDRSQVLARNSRYGALKHCFDTFQLIRLRSGRLANRKGAAARRAVD
jgi:transposase